jgi:hypothetical protein
MMLIDKVGIVQIYYMVLSIEYLLFYPIGIVTSAQFNFKVLLCAVLIKVFEFTLVCVFALAFLRVSLCCVIIWMTCVSVESGHFVKRFRIF